MRITNNNKGFSLVELLIALLIMAVIAAIAIAMFGGILDTSKGAADRETGETIKKAILNYVNSTNDTQLTGLGGVTSTGGIITRLGQRFDIKGSGGNKQWDFEQNGSNEVSITTGNSIQVGTFGPFIDSAKAVPQQANMKTWAITYSAISQKIEVAATSQASVDIVIQANN